MCKVKSCREVVEVNADSVEVYKLCAICGAHGHCAYDCMAAMVVEAMFDDEPEEYGVAS